MAASVITYPVSTTEEKAKLVATWFVANGASDPTSFDTKHISSVVHVGTGIWSVILRHAYGTAATASIQQFKALAMYPVSDAPVDFNIAGDERIGLYHTNGIPVNLIRDDTIPSNGTGTTTIYIVFVAR